jgi:Flp pilus assembly protein TadD
MPTPFLSSEEYDERAHKLYDRGDYDAALDTLKEGLDLYPHAVDLYVGLGYTRLAREEFVWAKQAFEKALVMDPEHDDALVGLGETLLRFGQPEQATAIFQQVRTGPAGEDVELLLAMGRALFREGRYQEARVAFESALQASPEDAEVTAALGFTLHKLGEEDAAIRELRGALAIHPAYHETRVYLGHILYDRGDWKGALATFAVPAPAEHWDALAVWRLIELKKSEGGLDPSDPELMIWEDRLDELDTDVDPLDEMLAEIEASGLEPGSSSWGAAPRKEPQVDAAPADPPGGASAGRHRVRLPDGSVFEGSWLDIVRQLRDQAGRSDESVAQFMRRWADDTRVRIGVGVPADDAEGFLLAHARAGLLHIER